ncbi:hypothetical protein EMCRGX_G024201 [Ephydatia muelleri]
MPTSQAAPNVTALNAVTALSNTADPLNPSVPNGIITACNVRQRSTALWKQHAPQLDVRLVVLPMSQHWIVATVQFHAYNPSGILFYQINSVITDFLGVKMHGGLPWLIFDVGSGPAVVGSNSTRTFIDGQWHTGHVVLFEQASNTFYVTVDTVHAAAITDVIVPLLTMKHVSYPLLNAPDGFDAVSVQNVGSTYIIVVLGLANSHTLSAGQVLQSRPQALHSSWNMVLGVISAAASLPRPYGGAYSHSPIPQLEQDVGMGHLFPPPPLHKLEILDPSLKLDVLSCQDQLNRMPLQ